MIVCNAISTLNRFKRFVCRTHSMCERKTTDRNEITRKHAHIYTHGTDIHSQFSYIFIRWYSCSLTTRDCAFHSNIFFFFDVFNGPPYSFFFLFCFSFSSFSGSFLLWSLWVYACTLLKYTFLGLPVSRALVSVYVL